MRNYWSPLVNEKKKNFRFLHVSTDEVFGDLESSTLLFTEKTAYAQVVLILRLKLAPTI